MTLKEIPTAEKVHALARTTAERTGVWWQELQLLLVAYSGMRWGEHVALTYDQVDLDRRRQDIYIRVCDDMFDRFFHATAQCDQRESA